MIDIALAAALLVLLILYSIALVSIGYKNGYRQGAKDKMK